MLKFRCLRMTQENPGFRGILEEGGPSIHRFQVMAFRSLEIEFWLVGNLERKSNMFYNEQLIHPQIWSIVKNHKCDVENIL